MPSLSRSAWVLFLGTLLAVLLGGASWWYFSRGPQLDQLAREAFRHAEETTSYGQKVTTETVVEDRKIRVEGTYLLDNVNKKFSSSAATSLTLPDGSTHSFDLQTITVGEDMYVNVESHSTALNLTVPAVGEWKQFKVSAIPPEYREIATPRPPIDNLTLFQNGGQFLDIREARNDNEKNGETLAHYTFGLSSRAFTEKTGPISMIAERVGVHGIVEIWVRESDAQIRYIRFSNDPYRSETAITHIGTLPKIEPPPTYSDGTLQI